MTDSVKQSIKMDVTNQAEERYQQEGTKGLKMQNKLNGKSAAIGAVVGAIAALCIGAATQNTATGRYKLTVFEPPNYAPCVLKIDTMTGQVWSSTPGHQIPWAEFMGPNAGN